MSENRLKNDLLHITELGRTTLQNMRGARLFITGGTGFFGKWLLEGLQFANDELNLQLKISVLSRNPSQFQQSFPHLCRENMQLIAGDVRDFAFPSGQFDYIIHAATDAGAKLNAEGPFEMIDTCMRGTEHTLNFAEHCKAAKVLLTSSGAVYGAQPSEIVNLPDDYKGGPDQLNLGQAYAEGKRISELLSVFHARKYNRSVKIARCFAFAGPYLPIDTHFAIGNFVNDVLHGRDIQILGDGTPHRSYLYASDLVIWLLKILDQGESARTYNVGSEKTYSIAELAEAVKKVCHDHNKELGGISNKIVIHIAKMAPLEHKPVRYVPATTRAQKELSLKEHFSLEQSIVKMIRWHKNLPT